MFRLVLAEREDLRPELTSFDIAARSRDGHERRVGFQIATGRDDLQAPHVVEGPVCEGSLSAQVIAPVLLYVETAAVDPTGVLHVVGWSVAVTQIVDIKIFVGEHRVGSAQLGWLRDDIARVFPDYPDAHVSGFTFSKALPEGAVPDCNCR